jgi:pimeloyl-ACP methyl ester carboxylesterase
VNTMAPKYFNVSGIVDLDPKPPIAWVHGTLDPIVSDTSFYDYNHLGQLGIIPDWPGADLAPAQEMVSQMRDVLDAYSAAGGQVTEVRLEGVGHSAHLEAPAEFRHAVLSVIGYVGTPANPSPPTETIILKSED